MSKTTMIFHILTISKISKQVLIYKLCCFDDFSITYIILLVSLSLNTLLMVKFYSLPLFVYFLFCSTLTHLNSIWVVSLLYVANRK